ncbi:MAG: ATP-dependent DNA helicase RecG [Oligoflexia bacterium]|nr:ATP-dependent DNA helicase RecG [Oligoflexia bacterium]
MIRFDTPIQYLKGVGPKIAALLARKEIFQVGDILTWFPRSYEDLKAAKHISQLKPGETASFIAQVGAIREIPLGKSSRRIHEMIFTDNTGRISGKWFRVPFRNYFKTFKPGDYVRVTGEIKSYRHTVEIHHPDVQKRDEEATLSEGEKGLLPIYSETEGLNQKLIRKIVTLAFENAQDEIEETLPQWLLKKYNYPDLKTSLLKVHHPGENENFTLWSEYKTPYQMRLIFEELFWLELMLAQSRAGIVKEKSPAFKPLLSLAQKMRKNLPFQLTDDQEKVIAEITLDLIKPHPMHRLVQGDVGCGKTVVALLTSAMVLENGYQVAMMAPTEILAEQHFLKAKELLEPLGIKCALLTGSQKEKQAKEIKKNIVEGNAQLIVGTHALIQEDVEFFKLGLVIIDEQHRFGVKQRAELKKKGLSPHFLVMTATPIPRTLAMTVYGDLDVSIIKTLPKGRQPIVTKVVHESKRQAVYGFLKDQLAKNRQAYVIYPLVEENEKMDLKNATDSARHLEKEFAPYKVGLLHGRMKADEKETLMRDFKSGTIKILVATTVVEVGVDVPQATMILIEHAERFGLSQLHQLRGRVGRGADKSYCVLMTSYAQSNEAKERLQVMTETSDGFKIAEKDLILRGPGEFLGTRQSGLPGFRMANLVRDIEILIQAREAAFEILKNDPKLLSPDNLLLHQAIIEKKKPSLLFAKIG